MQKRTCDFRNSVFKTKIVSVIMFIEAFLL